MSKITGIYEIDLENSAKLVAGFFHERFTMKPGYDDAIQRFMRSHAEAVKGVSLSIDSSRVVIRSPEGEEAFPVLELDQASTPARLVIDWEGDTTFNVVEVTPGSIHLQNPEKNFGEWVWRRMADA